MSRREGRGPDRAKRATIKDVARLSGVSIATVTRALHGHPRVRPETRARVEAAAAKLRYRPDTVARALVTGMSGTIGLLVPSSGDPYWGRVAEGCEQEAATKGYSILLANSHADVDRERELIGVFAGKQVEGILIAGVSGDPTRWFESGAPSIPLALVGWDDVERAAEFDLARRLPVKEAVEKLESNGPKGEWSAHLRFDDLDGARKAAEHLLELGHTRIGYVAGLPRRPSISRLLGIRQALDAAGLGEPDIVTCDESLESARAAATALLERPERPTAIIAYDDVVAIGVIRAAHAFGLDVPGDVSVVGFDDIEIAGYLEPPLTTVHQPTTEMGRRATELLMRAIAEGGERVSERLQGELIVRESTAQPRG